MFDSIQVRFKDVENIESPFANTRVVPFIGSYFEILKSVINDVKTDHFWFFSNFVDLSKMDLDYIPELYEENQLHVWHTAGLNQEGNVMLVPTNEFKKQLKEINFLRDFNYINYHYEPTLWQRPIGKLEFDLGDPLGAYKGSDKFYTWLINKDCQTATPDFYPSFWEDLKMYTWGETKDIMLLPGGKDLEQFYEIDRHVHYDLEYDVKPMDIVFLSYDEPSAEKYWEVLKDKYPRAKRIQGIKGRTKAYHAAAQLSETDYFFAVFPTIELEDSFDFSFQPDRLKNPCHYIFHAKNPVTGLEYGHRAVLLYNKQLCLATLNPGLDFTLSQPHTVVPILSGTSHFNQTPEISWRVAFREVLKLCKMKPTVESQYRLRKWCLLGKGNYADFVQKGATDAVTYYEKHKDDHDALMLSYELDWLKERFKTIS